jgi:hypothetical protein
LNYSRSDFTTHSSIELFYTIFSLRELGSEQTSHDRSTIMSTLMLEGTAAASNLATQGSKAATLRVAALGVLSIRFIQGFVYWGGGSRRFIYAPAKLDPNAASWMANKFQSAMPGALLGTDHIIAFLPRHFYLLYASLILFSAAETHHRTVLDDGLSHAGRGAGLDRPLSRTDADVRLAGRDLHR